MDADDLMALAAALGVSPISLLMPLTVSMDDTVDTSAGTLTAHHLWDWLTARTTLTGETASDLLEFISQSAPKWLVGTGFDIIEMGLSPHRRIQYGGTNTNKSESWTTWRQLRATCCRGKTKTAGR